MTGLRAPAAENGLYTGRGVEGTRVTAHELTVAQDMRQRPARPGIGWKAVPACIG